MFGKIPVRCMFTNRWASVDPGLVPVDLRLVPVDPAPVPADLRLAPVVLGLVPVTALTHRIGKVSSRPGLMFHTDEQKTGLFTEALD